MPTPTFTWGTPVYHDGDPTTAARIGLPVLSSPIPGVAAEYVLTEKWMVYRRNFTPLALNTLHPEFKTANSWERDFFLVSESPRQDAGGGLVTWERTYAAVPAQHVDYETFVYQFPGYMGFLANPATLLTDTPGSFPVGREPFSDSVTSRIVTDYYLCASGQAYTTPGAIPTVPRLKYYYTTADQEAKYLADNPPYAVQSTPSRATYSGYVTGGTEIVVEDSKLDRWMGNIYQRRTRYAVAK